MLIMEMVGTVSKYRWNITKLKKSIIKIIQEKYWSSSALKADNPQVKMDTYINEIKKSLSSKGPNIATIFDIENIVAMNSFGNFEYYIFTETNNNISGKGNAKINILIFSRNTEITESIENIINDINQKIGIKYKFRLSKKSKCKIYSHDMVSNDIHDSNQFIESEISPKTFMSSLEKKKFSITLFVGIILLFIFLSQSNQSQTVSSGQPNNSDPMLLRISASLLAGTLLTFISDVLFIIIRYNYKGSKVEIDSVEAVIDSFTKTMTRSNIQKLSDSLEDNLPRLPKSRRDN